MTKFNDRYATSSEIKRACRQKSVSRAQLYDVRKNSYLVSTWQSFVGILSCLNRIIEVVSEVNCTVQGSSLAEFSRSLILVN